MIGPFNWVAESLSEMNQVEFMSGLLFLSWFCIPMYYRMRITKLKRQLRLAQSTCREGSK